MHKYDVIICGAGPAGLLTGISLLRNKRDARVLIIESREEVGEEKCGEGLGKDWLYKHLEDLGSFLLSKLSKKCFENEIYGFVLVMPSGKKIKVRTKETQGWILNKDLFLKNLARIFEKLGGEIKTGTSVEKPLVEKGRVKSVETNDGERFEADCFIDATGLSQNIWRKALNIKEPLDKKDIEVCCQYKIVDSQIEEPDLIQIYFGNEIAPGGYGWVFPKSYDRANVGLGCQASRVSNPFPYQEKFWRMLKLKGKIVSVKGGAVSTFNLPEKFVWSNLACVGSSARFTNPVHGGGTGQALFGGYILGKHIARALKDDLSIEEALADYQREIKERRGKEHEYHYRAKNLLQACNDEELEIIFTSIQPKEWLNSMSLSKKDVLRIVARISKRNVKLGLKVIRYLKLKRI